MCRPRSGLMTREILISHCPLQPASLCDLRVKDDARLLKNPRLYLFVMHAQQVERAPDVVLLAHALGRMPLNLRAHPAGYVEPLTQAGEAPA